MPPGQPVASSGIRNRTVAAALAAVAFAVHSRALGNDFTLFDDPAYVTNNPSVLDGLTLRGLRWAFTTTSAANWHPLTWLSHMLDVSLFGVAPGGHHLTSLLLHALATALLFLALARLTGRRWPSALVAALFALHPLHVESVAWVAERKDVLCASLWAAVLLAYERRARRPTPARSAALVVLFALALLAKPMAVTLPLVLLLLDAWPLGRWRDTPGWRLAAEKSPLLALALASGVVTYLAQAAQGATTLTDRFTLGTRAANAALSYVVYVRQTLWPAGLIAFYPHPGRSVDPLAVAASTALLVAATALAAALWRRRPWLAVGWSWYLLTLLPVIGLVQVGRQAHADRYTYLPLIGLFVALAWSLATPRWRPPTRRAIVGFCGLALAALSALTWVQIGHWRDTLSLFGRVVTRDVRNMIAHNMVGSIQLQQGRLAEAAAHFEEAVRIDPSLTDAWFNLGLARERQGDPGGAQRAFSRVLADDPRDAETRFLLARSLAGSGRLEESERLLRALAGDPGVRPEALGELAAVLARRGQPAEAVARYREALARAPGDAAMHHALGILLAERGDAADAIRHLERATALEPSQAGYRYDLARALDLAARTGEAEAAYREALRLRPDFAAAFNNLGALLAARGDRGQARALFLQALRLNPDSREARANLDRLDAR